MIGPRKISRRVVRFYTKLFRNLFFGKPSVSDQRARAISHMNNKVMRQAGVEPLAYKIVQSQEQQPATDVILRKEQGSIVALVRTDCEWEYVFETRNKIAPYVFWFQQTSDDVRQITVNAADGNLASIADYRFSSMSDQHVLLPDAHFFAQRGYAETDIFAANNRLSWDNRSDDIVWRGAVNGTGHWSVDPETVILPGMMQRLHMAHKCKALDVDFRFVVMPEAHDYTVLKDAGFVGDFIPTHNWGVMKYAIDIDGFTNAWCNLMQRLKLGCCVLKVASPFGYKQWYYNRLIPWEHFVPISADLSDLRERIDWVKSHPAETRDIARQGQILAKNLTFESETVYAVRAIEERERHA